MRQTESFTIRMLVIGLVAGGMVAATAAAAGRRPEGDLHYVGSKACQGCHPDEYQSFIEHAKKARSFASVEKMRPKLTPEEYRGCLHCHTTGFGRPGGFVSEEATPELKNAGCEVCHGPGSRHVASAEAADIQGVLNRQDCEACHNKERVEAFHYTPLIFGGGH